MNLPDENQRVKILIDYYYKGNESQFSKSIGISQPRINRLFNLDPRNGKHPTVSLEIAQAIINKFIEVNPEWFITGKGAMLKDKNSLHESCFTITNKTSEPNPDYVSSAKKITKIPLITTTIIGNFNSNAFILNETDVKDYYVIPKFTHKKIDFMIEVESSSMYPKYNPGDIVACKVISERSFIQWNKPHVIVTKGKDTIINRVKKSDIDGALKMVSDNPDYDPFDIPLDEITTVAIIVGVIRLE